MSHELLERLFVARERTLESILARVQAAAKTTERNHTLLVGPRGSGKTHLVSLVYHRIDLLRSSGVPLQVAWLPEDAWTIVSYRHLLTAVAERLEPGLEEELPGSTAELEALLVRRAAAGGPIVVLVENLDQILSALRDEGQQQLRHLLQAHRPLLLVATSTRLDRALSDQARPFYGFFTTTRLEPFDVDEAAAMLAAIARERGDDALVDYLDTDQGRARLRTIKHLAGGQPRMWAVLASALTIGGLGELIELLLTRFDDLTPYYQEQLARLSGRQRLVVAELAEVDHPVNVSELAARLELDQRSLGKTMSELMDQGWVAPTKSTVTVLLDRRRTYYELAEPLARVSFQIKESRGEPLRLVVEFLKHWFDPTDLRGSESGSIVSQYMLIATAGQSSDPVVAVSRRLEGLPPTRAPAATLLGEIDEALAALFAGDPEPFLRLPTPVRSALEQNLDARGPTSVRDDIHQTALEEFGYVQHPAMDRWIARTEAWIAVADEQATTTAQLRLADWLGRAWRFDEAREVLAAAADAPGADFDVLLAGSYHLAVAYMAAGRVAEAIAVHERVLADCEGILGAEHWLTLAARSILALALGKAGHTEEAIAVHERVLADCEGILGAEHWLTLAARSNLALAFGEAGRIEEAIERSERVLADCERILGEDHPVTLMTRSYLAEVSAPNSGSL
jgi:tetratricopeptide (TPR) repeat protein